MYLKKQWISLPRNVHTVFICLLLWACYMLPSPKELFPVCLNGFSHLFNCKHNVKSKLQYEMYEILLGNEMYDILLGNDHDEFYAVLVTCYISRWKSYIWSWGWKGKPQCAGWWLLIHWQFWGKKYLHFLFIFLGQILACIVPLAISTRIQCKI